MILLQEDHNAVAELDARGLVGLELVQLRHGNLLPGLGLLCGRYVRCERDTADNGCQKHNACGEIHCAPPLFSSLEAFAGAASVSISPMVRLEGTKTCRAIRRISALLTLSTRSSCRNNSRQSP